MLDQLEQNAPGRPRMHKYVLVVLGPFLNPVLYQTSAAGFDPLDGSS